MSNPVTLKGESVEVVLKYSDGTHQIGTAKDLEVTFKVETVTEDYLGKFTGVTDENFDGADFSFGMHHDNTDFFDLISAVILRAKTQDPGITVDVSAHFKFGFAATEVTHTVTLPDVKFNSPNIGSRDRKSKVETKLTGHADNVIIS